MIKSRLSKENDDNCQSVQEKYEGPVEGRWSTLPMDLIISALLWLVFVFVPWRAIRKRQAKFSLDLHPQGDYRLEQAQFLFNLGQRASERTDQKAKHLLGLSSALVTLLFLFAPKVEPTWLVLLPMIALFFSVLLCVTVLGVRVEMIPELESSQSDPKGSQWARDILKSYHFNRGQHLFLVNLFAASRRWLILALLSLFLIALLSVDLPQTNWRGGGRISKHSPTSEGSGRILAERESGKLEEFSKARKEPSCP